MFTVIAVALVILALGLVIKPSVYESCVGPQLVDNGPFTDCHWEWALGD